MKDIKLTLSQNTKLRSPDIEHEAHWVNHEGPIYYPLPTCPREAKAGCWVYFIRDGKLVARAKANEFCQSTEGENLVSFTGVSERKGGWHVMCTLMEVLPQDKCFTHLPPYFQGFHYVRPEEHAMFEEAFKT